MNVEKCHQLRDLLKDAYMSDLYECHLEVRHVDDPPGKLQVVLVELRKVLILGVDVADQSGIDGSRLR